jgi:predicted DNA-binding transcriptional regulator AlpA
MTSHPIEPATDHSTEVPEAATPVVSVAEPLLLRASEAAAICGISTRTWRSWDCSCRIPRPIRIGRAVFWRPDEVRAWVAAGCPDRETWHAAPE